MVIAEPFAVERLKFDTELECLQYLHSNPSTLAIEVIDRAGFNDELVDVQCIPDYKIKKDKKET